MTTQINYLKTLEEREINTLIYKEDKWDNILINQLEWVSNFKIINQEEELEQLDNNFLINQEWLWRQEYQWDSNILINLVVELVSNLIINQVEEWVSNILVINQEEEWVSNILVINQEEEWGNQVWGNLEDNHQVM